MTTEGTAPGLVVDTADEGRLTCYRHPDRETYVRCGRCDRPICPPCAMQGPVGFRCRSCGKPAVDPLTSLKPRQAVLGAVVAVGASTVAGTIAISLGGFWMLLVAFFGGGIIADSVMRVTGFKRGPVMAAVLLGGIAVGTLVALGLAYGLLVGGIAAGGEGPVDVPFLAYLSASWLWAALYAGVAMVGAWGRLRI